MGQCVRNVSYNSGSKILTFEGHHGRTYNVIFDDVDDAHLQGDRKGTKPASGGSVTLDAKTGIGTFDTTSKSFTGGTVHSVRFVDPVTGHVTLRSSFTA